MNVLIIVQSHTILGSKSQRGLTQMALDVLFQTTGDQLVQSFYGAPAFSSLAAADASEANMFTATAYLDSMYGDNQSERYPSRANTPMPVSTAFQQTELEPVASYTSLSSPSHTISSENLHSVLMSTFSARPSAGIHSIRPVNGALSSISRSVPNAGSPYKRTLVHSSALEALATIKFPAHQLYPSPRMSPTSRFLQTLTRSMPLSYPCMRSITIAYLIS